MQGISIDAAACPQACKARLPLPPTCRRPRCPVSTRCQSSRRQQQPHEAEPKQPLQRRTLLQGALLLAAAAAAPPGSRAEDPPAAQTAGSSSSGGEESSGLVTFSNPAQGYTLQRPSSWEQVGKAGADSLFRDPERKSTTVGVTVYPVTIASLEQFGDLQTVGERLLGTEKEKESTLGAAMVSQQARKDAAGGFSIYDFEYELESTRGRKRILSTVAIAGRKLYIANGSVSCGKEASCDGQAAVLPLVRRVTQSLQIAS